MEQPKNNIISMPYNDMFSHINSLSFSKKVSFICIDSEFNNNLIELKIPDKISNFFVLSNNKEDLHIPHLYYYKKINKKILKLTYNTSIIVSIKINDSDDDNSIKKIIKSLISLIKMQKNNIILYNINCVNTKYYNDILNSIIALQFNSKKEQYEYIYDTVCDELDKSFSQNNYCDFKNDRCIANREKVSTKDIMGCCYSFKYTALGNTTERHLCKYLNNKKCSTKCLTCKLYTCKYLKDKGIIFKAKDNILLSCFFNKKQLRVLSSNYFICKEKMIDKLLENDHLPYIIYYILNKEYIPVDL